MPIPTTDVQNRLSKRQQILVEPRLHGSQQRPERRQILQMSPEEIVVAHGSRFTFAFQVSRAATAWPFLALPATRSLNNTSYPVTVRSRLKVSSMRRRDR